MSADWLPTAAFLLTTVFVLGLASTVHVLFFQYRSRLRTRLHELSDAGTGLSHQALFTRHGDDRSGYSWRSRIEAYYESAKLGIELTHFLQWTVGAALSFGILAAALTGRLWLGAACFLVVTGAAVGYVIAGRRRRRTKLMQQLPHALDAISRAVRAGQTLPAAFQLVANDFESPIADEFRLCYEEQNLGISYEASLRNLARRTELMELQILVVALLVQIRAGGNLAELLGNLSQMVQKRLRLQERVRALTGEGRMQAAVLIALPTVAFVLLLFIARDYVMTLWAYPALLATSLAAQFVGAIWIRRCIHFEY